MCGSPATGHGATTATSGWQAIGKFRLPRPPNGCLPAGRARTAVTGFTKVIGTEPARLGMVRNTSARNGPRRLNFSIWALRCCPANRPHWDANRPSSTAESFSNRHWTVIEGRTKDERTSDRGKVGRDSTSTIRWGGLVARCAYPGEHDQQTIKARFRSTHRRHDTGILPYTTTRVYRYANWVVSQFNILEKSTDTRSVATIAGSVLRKENSR